MKEIALRSLCRLCLSNGFSFSDIFLDRSFSGHLIYEAINFVYNRKISENDSLPSNICHPCLWKLMEFETYKRNVLAAEKELLNLVERSVKDVSEADGTVIKEEDQPLLVDEGVVGQGKEDLEVCVLKREGEIEVLEHEENPPFSLTTGLNAFTEHCKDDQSFPANLQIENVYSINTLSEVPEVQRAHFVIPSEGMKADNKSEDKLHIADCKSVILNAVTLNSQKGLYGHKLTHACDKGVIKDKKKFACQICGKAFRLRSDLSFHIGTHFKRKIYPCTVCGKCYKQNGYRLTHQRSHIKENMDLEMRQRCEDRSIICTICGMQFLKNIKFLHHSLTHEVKSLCFVCGKQFSSKVSLDIHHRSHIRRKEFDCKICRTSLKSLYAFKDHVKWHSGVKPYSCSICKKMFKSREDFSLHVKSHAEEAEH